MSGGVPMMSRLGFVDAVLVAVAAILVVGAFIFMGALAAIGLDALVRGFNPWGP